MIKNKNRAGWFGASDTAKIMGNWNTKTFAKWWCEKLGFIKNEFQTKYTLAGTYYEHKIAQSVSEIIGKKLTLDRQVKFRKLKLRINLDCEDKFEIHEIKTFKEQEEEWKCPKNYIMQVRVQMFFCKKRGNIWAYPLKEENYINYFLPINKLKLIKIEIKQDEDFIKEYLKRLKYLANCLKENKYPKIEEIK